MQGIYVHALLQSAFWLPCPLSKSPYTVSKVVGWLMDHMQEEVIKQ